MFRKIGIVGGMEWRATVECYEALQMRASRDGRGDAALEIAIESLDSSVVHDLLADGERGGRWEGFDNYHRAALVRLQRSEAELVVFVSHTAQDRLPSITRGASINVIDLFDILACEVERREARRLLSLEGGSAATSVRLRSLIEAHGADFVAPTNGLATVLEQLTYDLRSNSGGDALIRLAAIVEDALGTVSEHDLILLRCTELEDLLPSCRLPVCDWQRMRFLNATIINADAALKAAYFAGKGCDSQSLLGAPELARCRARAPL